MDGDEPSSAEVSIEDNGLSYDDDAMSFEDRSPSPGLFPSTAPAGLEDGL